MKIEKPGGHIDHLLRQTRAHHVQLSQMADIKANMLLTVSMLVITFTAPRVTDPDLRWAAIIVCASCLATVVLAAYAVMPKIMLPGSSRKPPPKPDIRAAGFNLLFFGDFTRISYEEFEAAMEQAMNDPTETYRMKLREIYTMGQFLASKKYRFIRLAYTTFILGLLASGLALAITIWTN
jgi:hypothetical protein